MGKMFLSLGFWMTILLFIALGYTFQYAWGSECTDAMNCGYTRSTSHHPFFQIAICILKTILAQVIPPAAIDALQPRRRVATTPTSSKWPICKPAIARFTLPEYRSR